MHLSESCRKFETNAMIEFFENTIREGGEEEALFIEKDEKLVGFTWNNYLKYSKNFAKALISVGIEPYKTVNIIGFNSPEWFYAFMGSMYACVPPVGVYPTSSTDACVYMAENSECACLVLDGMIQFRKYEKDLKKLKQLKVVVFYCELTETELKSLVNPFVSIYQWTRTVPETNKERLLMPYNQLYFLSSLMFKNSS